MSHKTEIFPRRGWEGVGVEGASAVLRAGAGGAVDGQWLGETVQLLRAKGTGRDELSSGLLGSIH